MGRVYELLHRSGDHGGVSLKPLFDGLVDQATSICGEKRIVIDRDLEEFRADTKTAIPLAIIANELLTNVAKYGAQKDRSVRVRVSFARDRGDGATLTVSDDGHPFGRNVLAGEYGFGLRMVQALTHQLGGEMTLSNDPEPTVAVRVPAGLQRIN
jgi:two-component sensor histidine kinase